jgi:hypothetical protein
MKTVNSSEFHTGELNSSNLGRIISELADNQKLEITNIGGITRISIIETSKKHRYITPMRNCLEAFLHSSPIKPGWMSYSEIEPVGVKKARKEHRSTITKKANQNKRGNAELLDIFDLCLGFKTIKDAVIFQSGRDTYYIFNVGKWVIYTNGNKTPVMYRIGQDGELKYLSSNEKPKLGTYKMINGSVVQV